MRLSGCRRLDLPDVQFDLHGWWDDTHADEGARIQPCSPACRGGRHAARFFALQEAARRMAQTAVPAATGTIAGTIGRSGVESPR